jgi:hypothetical protein
MFTKSAQHVAQAFALIFTSVVAPVAVQLIVRDLNGDESAKAPLEQPASQKTNLAGGGDCVVATATPPASPAPSPPPRKEPHHVIIHPDALIKVVVQGTGSTHDDALQQALRMALYKASVAEVGADCWCRRGHAIFEEAWHNTGGIIRTWKTLAVTTVWQSGGWVYLATAAVEVDRQALLAQFGAGCLGASGAQGAH